MNISHLISKKTESSILAKDRLNLILIHDRMNCSPDLLERIKTDIISVLSKYISFETEEIEITMINSKSENLENELPTICANIPINKIIKKNLIFILLVVDYYVVNEVKIERRSSKNFYYLF